MKKFLNDLDLEIMSERDLKHAKKQIEKRLEAVKKEKEETAKRKAEYHLVEPPAQYKENFEKMWQKVRQVIADGGVVDSGNIEEIYQDGLWLIPAKKEDIYPCPQCGEMALYVGKYGEEDIWGEYRCKRVTCQNCGFEPGINFEETDIDSWDSFHQWLVKNGYLDK